MYPTIAKNIIDDFTQTSYLGAIVVAFETIILGIISFYSYRQSGGVYAAEVLFWIASAGSSFVAFGGIWFMYSRQKRHSMDDVTGVWFLTFIPLIVCSTVGGSVAPYLGYKNGVLVLFVSFLMWSLGVGLSLMLVPIYVWRLMSSLLPQNAVIISTFVPIGPFGMGAYSTQQMASGIAKRIRQHEYTFSNSPLPPAEGPFIATIGEGIQWAGILLALFQLAVASFFLIEGVLATCTRAPGPFNVGRSYGPLIIGSSRLTLRSLLELCLPLWRLCKCLEHHEHKSAKQRAEGMGGNLHGCRRVVVVVLRIGFPFQG